MAKQNAQQRAMARMAEEASETALDPDAPLNRTKFAYQAPDDVPGDLVRAHRAHGAGPSLPLEPFSRIQRACQHVLGHELTPDDARTYITRLSLACKGPLSKMHRVDVCVYGLLAAVVCQPSLGDIRDLDRTGGALHDVLLYGPAKITHARRCLNACLAYLRGEDLDGPKLSLHRPDAPPQRVPKPEQLELFPC